MKKIVMAAICLVVILGFIWGNSILVADNSTSISDGIFGLIEGIPLLKFIDKYEFRKFAHLFEFLFLGVILFAFHRGRYSFSQHTLIGLLVALVDETIQLTTEGRSAQITDVWIDVAGFCIGSILAYLIYKLIQHFKRT